MATKDQMMAFVNGGNGGDMGKGSGASKPAEMSKPDETGGGEAVAKYAEAIETLEMHADDIVEAMDMVDDALLTDADTVMDEEQRAAFDEAVVDLDGAVHDAVREHMADITWDEAQQVAEHLATEGNIDQAQAEHFGGFLYLLAHDSAAAPAASDEGMEGDEPDDGAEEMDLSGE
jgi:uncharacterized protein YukE